jgi:hypothetical protein
MARSGPAEPIARSDDGTQLLSEMGSEEDRLLAVRIQLAYSPVSALAAP